jgi:putative Holliday junction resolvase
LRLLGVDFGFKRIGIAIAETDPMIISARPAIDASGTLKVDAGKLAAMAVKEEAGAVVVGLPVEESGGEGRMARICRTLASHISATGLAVHLVDERLTSVEAESTLRDDGLKASERRKLKDGEAARLILERYIATLDPGEALPQRSDGHEQEESQA